MRGRRERRRSKKSSACDFRRRERKREREEGRKEGRDKEGKRARERGREGETERQRDREKRSREEEREGGREGGREGSSACDMRRAHSASIWCSTSPLRSRQCLLCSTTCAQNVHHRQKRSAAALQERNGRKLCRGNKLMYCNRLV
jgi:hypothetical protein